MAVPQRWSGEQGATLVRVVVGGGRVLAAGGWMEAVPAGAAEPARREGDRLLLRLRACDNHAAGGGRGGGAALEHRDRIRAGEAGGRAGRVRGEAVGWLEPLHGIGAAGPRLPRRAAGAGPRTKRGSGVGAPEESGTAEGELVPLS